jgi:hypothetical protein
LLTAEYRSDTTIIMRSIQGAEGKGEGMSVENEQLIGEIEEQAIQYDMEYTG